VKVYLVWCDFDVLGVYATQEMAADYIKRELDEIEAKLGFRPAADFRIYERHIIGEDVP
jgi:hypothetical protein